jgi:hypothetical protein
MRKATRSVTEGEDEATSVPKQRTPRQAISIYEADLMRVWSKSSEAMIRSEAQRLIAEHGNEAAEVARREARRARNTRNHALARKYALVAAYISEQTQPA